MEEKLNNESKYIEKIIGRGDLNQAFKTNEEMEIYLKHLIANKDFYINRLYDYKDFNGNNRLAVKAWEFGIGMISTILTGFGLAFLAINFLMGNISGCITLLQAIAALDIPAVLFLLTNKKIRKINATKKVNNRIKDLENALSLEASRNFEKSLEEIKTMIKESTTPSKKYSQDAFIANIQRDMEIVASLKYDGYESDLRKLCCLAESYISKKQTIKTTNPTDVLSNNDWFKPLIEIEAKFKNAPQLQEDQQDLKEALTAMRELLLKESMQAIEQEPSATEDNGYQPTLSL